jgi:thioredoxin 1
MEKCTLGARIDALIADGNPLLIEFYATWCPHCRRMKPIVADVADEVKGRANVVSVDADLNPDLTARFAVDSFPTWIFFRDGALTDRFSGETTAATLLRHLDPHPQS